MAKACLRLLVAQSAGSSGWIPTVETPLLGTAGLVGGFRGTVSYLMIHTLFRTEVPDSAIGVHSAP